MAPTARRTRGAVLLAVLACACACTGLTSALAAAASGPLGGAPPAIIGKLLDGKRLKGANGGWSGVKPISYAYVWERCDGAGSACAPIEGAHAATYLATPSDVGHRLVLLVTASNSEGAGEATSTPSATVAAALPKRKGAAPPISGSARDGQVLTVATGAWKGTAPISFAYQWQLCNGSACAPIAGANSSSYRPGTSQIGHKLRVEITASNSGGSSSRTSKKTETIAPGPPVNSAKPTVAGSPVATQTLTAQDGEWAGTAPFTYTYQWRSCNLASVCEDIAGAHAATYTVSPLEIANSIEVVVTAHNAQGSASATSEPTSAVSALAPKNAGLPQISGLAQDGAMLTAATGSWEGTEPLEYSYAWQLCNSAGVQCKTIKGASEETLSLNGGDVGSTVRAIVTAANSAGSASATSEPTSVIKALAPKNLELPTLSGLLQDGSLLSAVLGNWSGTGPLSFTYVWEQCDSAGVNCEVIEGETGATLKLITGLIGSTVRVAVTATNAAGSATQTSAATGLIKALLPSNIGLPSITGLLEDGGLLSALDGTWTGSGPLSFSYAWELCDAIGNGCEPISGALDATLSLVSGEVGRTVRLAVTATNGAGSKTAFSEPTSLIGALLPSNLSLPSITGLLQDGSSLTALLGSWKGTEPLSYAYQWQHCNTSGGECEDIKGATGATLGLLETLVGGTVRLLVTASNGAGSTTAASQPTGLIKALLPSNSGLPSIGGLLQDGSSLTALLGSWKGTGQLSYSYQWLLCDAAGEGCQEISGATGSTLGLLTGMIGDTVRLAVTATNAAGSTTATSEPSSLVKALLPSNSGLPSIVGSLIDGSLLSGGKGIWSGSDPSFSYQWLLCDSSGGACKEISGGNGTSLGLLTSMIGKTVRLAVTATNSAGQATATSQSSGLIQALLPSNTGLPSIAGLLEDAQTLTGAKGSWTGSEPSFSYQWLLCNGVGEGCNEINGATGSTLGLLTGMIGKTVRLAVTATNSAGSTTATSAPSSAVLAILPKIVSLPSVGGLLEDGQSLSAVKGTWEGSEPGYSYQWLLCGSGGGECKEISGATGTTLGLLTSEIGKTVKLAVTASNSRGSTTATSAPTSAILAILPKLLSVPTIGGAAEDGKTLTGGKGTWEGSEPSYSYQWKSCNSTGGACEEISKATGTSLGLSEALIGKTVRLFVTASNSRGSTTAESAPTSSVLAILPFKSTAPSIAGILQVGKILEVVPNGEWGGSEKPKAKWQWQTCGLLGIESECTNLAGAIAKTLKLELGWLGLTVRVVESATNTRGTVTKNSPITSTILGILLTPSKGASEGGTAVTLQAPEVSKASAVSFGSKQATGIEVDSPSEITVTTPPGSEGTVPVTVTTPQGTTHETPEAHFTYTGE